MSGGVDVAESKEALQAKWWERWWEQDFSWAGLADKPVGENGETIHGGLHGERDLQAYWRRDQVSGVVRDDAMLEAAGELLRAPDGRLWHVAHVPLHWRDGTAAKAGWNADRVALLAGVIAARTGAGCETAVDTACDADGADGRVQLIGAVLLAAPPHTVAPRVPLHLVADWAWMPAWDARSAAFGGGFRCHNAIFTEITDFGSATFAGYAGFDIATFSGNASFISATFSGSAGFIGATFSEYAWFIGATFSGTASFNSATLSGDAGFDSATFSGDAGFDGATFSGNARFVRATFSGYAVFGSATFSGDASFDSATFSGYAGFDSATFSGNARFVSATFSGDASLVGATFSGDASFDRATFSGYAGFVSATFSGDANFDSATFSGDAGFGGASFSGDAGFGGATFSGNANFVSATFSGYAVFLSATFSGYAGFVSATFSGNAGFDRATFSGDARFVSATFSGDADFNRATFAGDADFQDGEFATTAIFLAANFRPDLAEPRLLKRVRFRGRRFNGEATFDLAAFDYPMDFSATAFTRLASFAGITWPSDPRHWHRAFDQAVFKDVASFQGAGFRCFAAFDGAIFQGGLQFDEMEEAAASARFKQEMRAAIDLPAVETYPDPAAAPPPLRGGWPGFQDIVGRDLALQAAAAARDRAAQIRLKQLERGCRVLKQAMDKASDKTREQVFYAFELIARRMQKATPRWERWFSRLYEFFSDYSRSIAKPLFWLVLTIPGFALVYWGMASLHPDGWTWSLFWEAATFSLRRVLPFGPVETATDGLPKLLLGDTNTGFAVLMRIVVILQSVFALAMAFLAGLALRRRFQIT